MSARDGEGRFPEEFRREVFRALVEAQDRGERPELSRATAAGRFGCAASAPACGPCAGPPATAAAN